MNIKDHIPMCNNNEELIDELGKIFEKKHYELSRKKNRPYDGQPWTVDGIRGETMVEGLTMRDIKDCYVIACFQSSGMNAANYPDSIYDLPFERMDPIAIAQNMGCEIEKRMGIFPNIPE